ncbi:MAG: glycosyltransferase [Bacteroidota bacterium]
MSSPRHKVLFLASWYPNRLDPFLGNFVQRHAEAVSAFADVAVLHVCADPGLQSRFETEAGKEKNIFTVRVYYKKIDSGIPFISFIRKYIRNSKAHLQGYEKIREYFNGDPHIVHLHVALNAGFFALRLNKKPGIPFIVTEHSTEYHAKMPALRLFPAQRICGMAELVCPVSDDLREKMKERGIANHFEVVPNVVDTALFYPESGQARSKKRIIHVSTLKEGQKNASGMLRVIQRLSERRSDFELLIVSDGDIAPAQRQAERAGLLGSVVHILPAQPIEEVARLMRGSDIFLLFSNFENLPCVIAEALCCGLPVVSSRAGGIAEMVNGRNGLLVEPRDEQGLLEQLTIMLDRCDSYDKAELHRSAAEKYSYASAGKKFNDIYSRILHEKGKDR